jgi:hypothetical protein
LEDTHSGSVRQCLFSAAFVLLRFEAGIGLGWLLVGMVDWAIGLSTNLPHFALLQAVGNDGLLGELARLELRPFRLFWRIGFVLPNLNVLVAGDDLAALCLSTVGGADLD